MPAKEWVAEYKGHKIRVCNTWFFGAKLYIDGERRDTDNELLAFGAKPIMSARLVRDDSQSDLVEVFVRAVFTVKAKIYADGKQIGGDDF
ncbi:MAG: hypothetical protein IV086_14635 [Hyphomonadaceae bacterium]|nr:MAG: hypothetical protein FD160_2936 [Caulobacteraceae bacterium]MBT9446934.1 hypothetical protein [Hyphomonadaceae bacterium]